MGHLDYAQVPVEVFDAKVIDGRVSGKPVGEDGTALGHQHVQELVEGLPPSASEGADLLFGSWRREDFEGHSKRLAAVDVLGRLCAQDTPLAASHLLQARS